MEEQCICFVVLVVVLGTLTMQAYAVKEHKSEQLSEIEGSCDKCGLFNKLHSLIINGTDVNPPFKYPWMVYLSEKGMTAIHCGAALISEIYILTAVHCLNRDGYQISLEVWLLSNTTQVIPGPEIAEMIPHPDYENHSANDIGLIRLTNPVQCSIYTNPICLPEPAMVFRPRTVLVTAGWGESKSEGKTGILQETPLVLESHETCESVPDYNKELNLCLKGKKGGTSCFGDSGGPAFYQMAEKYFLIGVTSAQTSSECKTSARLIFVSVHSFMTWIQEITGIGKYIT